MESMNKLALLLLLTLFGCSKLTQPAPSEKVKITDEIMRKVAIELIKTSRLYPCGVGGQMMDQVKMLALSFDYKEPIQIDEARALLIKSVDTFLLAVNTDERVRPYLNNYPFRPQNLEVRIFLKAPDGREVPIGELCVISSIEGTFNYDVSNLERNRHITVLIETYAEAKQKMQN
jgi:3-dehydroquinate synthase class II